MPDIPRPLQHLQALMRRYPDLPHQVNDFRAGKGRGLPDWPNWCFIPFAAWYAVAMQRVPIGGDSLAAAADIAILGALAPWRYTQGIFRFDPDLLDALADTELSGILPAQVFLRLPQWSIYVELPPERFRWLGDPLHGFWASLEWDAGEHMGRHELRLLLDTDRGLIGLPLHLGAWTVAEALRRVVAEAQRNADALGAGRQLPPALHGMLAADLTPLLSLLLYLCSDEPEVDDEREPGHAPGNPQPHRVKGGLRLFPPDRPTIWSVGEGVGVQLRTAGAARTWAEQEPGAPRTVRPHLRRGHWHGYWLGPRDGERTFAYRWLHPMLIGGDNAFR